MTLTAAERQFLHIAKAVISGGDLPAEKVGWPTIFTLANQQKLLPILFEAVRKMPAAAENAALFPKREYLERRYPYLKKHPYLLPVAWAQRLAHYASEKQSGTDNSASGSIKLAKERIELMKRYGVMD